MNRKRTVTIGMTGVISAVTTVQVNWKAKGYGLVIHAGAGGRSGQRTPEEKTAIDHGLEAAFRAGEDVLLKGGTAEDAVCAAIVSMEDCEEFNAGRGAALTSTGRAELDASIMTNDGLAGAVAGSVGIRNPILAARKVMSETPHVLMIRPSLRQARQWGLRTEDPEYFITEKRRRQLKDLHSRHIPFEGHGTVGAVAIDRDRRVCAGTSTGGIADQMDGRVGDTPIIGAGTYARRNVAGISCTGQGEAFIRGVVAYDVIARMEYRRDSLRSAIVATILSNLTDKGANGGIIGLSADGDLVIGRNSAMINAAYRDGDTIVTLD